MSRTSMRRGLALRCYLFAVGLVPLVAAPMLRRRLRRGKEHPNRWQEKLGLNLAPRPDGPLIWLNAVGLGEVLSVRGLIARLAARRPDMSFVVTSSTAPSAAVFDRNIPDRTIHQFPPLDAPRYRRRFLNHFQPDMCIWVEQDLWPGLVSDMAKRGIPQCVVAARMDADAFNARRKVSSLYRDLYEEMAFVTAQDPVSAKHLSELGADVEISGSLKPAAPLLQCDPIELATFTAALAGRTVWAVAPAHDADIAPALEAHEILLQTDPSALLIIVPRFPDNIQTIEAPRRSKGELPEVGDPVWLCDTFGDLGLIYRLAQTVLIGGTFSQIEGHNPWEAAALGCAILHGPCTANFATDFQQLADANGAIAVASAQDIADALRSTDLKSVTANAQTTIDRASKQTDHLADKLLQVFEARHGL